MPSKAGNLYKGAICQIILQPIVYKLKMSSRILYDNGGRIHSKYSKKSQIDHIDQIANKITLVQTSCTNQDPRNLPTAIYLQLRKYTQAAIGRAAEGALEPMQSEEWGTEGQEEVEQNRQSRKRCVVSWVIVVLPR